MLTGTAARSITTIGRLPINLQRFWLPPSEIALLLDAEAPGRVVELSTPVRVRRDASRSGEVEYVYQLDIGEDDHEPFPLVRRAAAL